MLCIGEYLWNTDYVSAVAGGLYLPVGQTLVKLRLRSTCLGFGFCFGWLFWLPSSPVWVDQEVWWVPAFSRIAPEKYVIIIQGLRHHREEKLVPIYVILLWHCGSAKDLKSRKSLVCYHLPSFYRFTLSFYMLCECWQTVNSAVIFVEVFTKSTPFFSASEKEQLSI